MGTSSKPDGTNRVPGQDSLGDASPRPVRIVSSRRDKCSRFWMGVGGAVGQIALAALAVILTLMFAPLSSNFDTFLQNWSYTAPTCDAPQSLVMLDIAELDQTNAAEVVVSSARDEETWPILSSFDGSPGTGWVPAQRSARAGDEQDGIEVWGGIVTDNPRIAIRFQQAQRVQMLCIVNGSASGPISYTRADRIRTAKVLFGLNGREVCSFISPLRTLPEHEVQNRQMLGDVALSCDEEEFDEISLEIVDRYLGTMALDPPCQKRLGMLNEDCLLEATRLVMLGELEVYVSDD